MSFGDMIWNGQVWAILRMAEVLIIRDLRKLDLEAVPMMFRLAMIRIRCFAIESGKVKHKINNLCTTIRCVMTNDPTHLNNCPNLFYS